MIKNQKVPIRKMSRKDAAFNKKLKICSIRNQSKVLMYITRKIQNRNKFKEESNEIQKKNINDCKKVKGKLLWKKFFESNTMFL